MLPPLPSTTPTEINRASIPTPRSRAYRALIRPERIHNIPSSPKNEARDPSLDMLSSW